MKLQNFIRGRFSQDHKPSNLEYKKLALSAFVSVISEIQLLTRKLATMSALLALSRESVLCLGLFSIFRRCFGWLAFHIFILRLQEGTGKSALLISICSGKMQHDNQRNPKKSLFHFSLLLSLGFLNFQLQQQSDINQLTEGDNGDIEPSSDQPKIRCV